MTNVLRLPAVLQRTGLSRSSIYALAKQNRFPSPIKLTDVTSGWLESEVSDWLDRRIAETRQMGEAA